MSKRWRQGWGMNDFSQLLIYSVYPRLLIYSVYPLVKYISYESLLHTPPIDHGLVLDGFIHFGWHMWGFHRKNNPTNTVRTYIHTYIHTFQIISIQYNAIQYYTIQCNTIEYNTIQCNTYIWFHPLHPPWCLGTSNMLGAFHYYTITYINQNM